jgi:chromosome partitioning protein
MPRSLQGQGTGVDIWAVANQKGGVGKTTTVVTCAGLLAEAGKRVLMVDLDPQGSLTCYFRHDPATLRQGTFELFRDPSLPTAAALSAMFLPTTMPGLALFPAGPGLATVERQFRSEEGVGLRLARALASLRGSFDYALIDTPPVLGVLMVNALAASRRLLLPVQTDYLAIKGLEKMANTLGMIVRARQRELHWCVVPTMYDAGSESASVGLRALLRAFGERVGDTVVPLDNAFREASLRGMLPSRYAPASRGVNAYRALLRGLGAIAPAPVQRRAGPAA